MLLALVLLLPYLAPTGKAAPTAVSPATLVGLVSGAGKPLNGRPAPQGPIDGLSGRPQDRFAIVEIRGTVEPSVAYRDPKVPAGARPGFVIPAPSGKGWRFSKPLAAGESTDSISLGVATGAWKKVGSVALTKGVMGKTEGLRFLRMLRPETTADAKQALIADLALPTDSLTNAYEVRLLNRAGKPMPLRKRTYAPSDPSETAYEYGGTFEDATRLELWSRPYAWVTASGG